MSKQHDRMVPVSLTAAKLNLHPRTVRKWIAWGWIKAVRKNPRAKKSPHLVPQSEIERIQREREQQAGHAA